jgi:hypothetical protein
MVGAFLLIEGSEAALAPFTSTTGTLLVDDVRPYHDKLVAAGAEIIFPLQVVPTGAAFNAVHPDGTVVSTCITGRIRRAVRVRAGLRPAPARQQPKQQQSPWVGGVGPLRGTSCWPRIHAATPTDPPRLRQFPQSAVDPRHAWMLFDVEIFDFDGDSSTHGVDLQSLHVLPTLPWNGTLLLDAHVAVLQGHAGDSAAHAHYAHQLLLSDGAAWQVEVDGVQQQGQRLWLPSFQPHAILSAPEAGCTVFLEPAHADPQIQQHLHALPGNALELQDWLPRLSRRSRWTAACRRRWPVSPSTCPARCRPPISPRRRICRPASCTGASSPTWR